MDGTDNRAVARRTLIVIGLVLAQLALGAVCGGTSPMLVRVSIAAQACLPILELGLDWYSGWTGIVLYPGDFRVRRSELDENGVLHEWEDELALRRARRKAS